MIKELEDTNTKSDIIVPPYVENVDLVHTLKLFNLFKALSTNFRKFIQLEIHMERITQTANTKL